VQVLGVDTGDGTGYISGLAIEGNTFYSCPSSASVGHSIDVQAANNISVNNNQVMNGLANSTTISIQAVASATPAEIVNVCNNTVFECTGIGIFVQWATLGNVSGNAGHGNGSQLIEGRYCSSMNFIGNACTDQAVVVLTDTYTNTGNVIGANIGAYSVSQNVVNGCLILPSFSQTALFPAPSSIPVGTLSTTVSATTVYVATALTSAGNWTAVN
jgi:hypothetical protein